MRCSAAISPTRHPGGGMAEMDESDFADMVEQTPVRTYVIEYREPSVGRPAGQAGRRLPVGPAGRRPVDDLQLLRCRPGRAQGAWHLHHPRPHHPRRARRPALCLSRLLGRRLARAWRTRPASARSSGSAATAGGGQPRSSRRDAAAGDPAGEASAAASSSTPDTFQSLLGAPSIAERSALGSSTTRSRSTGAASGIGKATCELFRNEGATVVGADLKGADVACDAGFGSRRRGPCREHDCRTRTLDIFFANAGIAGTLDSVLEKTVDEWTEVLRVNLIGAFLAIKHAAPRMKTNGGSIICTASVAGLRSGAGPAAYSASKAGVINLVQVSAQQLSGSGVRVNAICPGLIETGMTRSSMTARATRRGGQDRPPQPAPPRRRAERDRGGGTFPGVRRSQLRQRPGFGRRRRAIVEPSLQPTKLRTDRNMILRDWPSIRSCSYSVPPQDERFRTQSPRFRSS